MQHVRAGLPRRASERLGQSVAENSFIGTGFRIRRTGFRG